MIQSERHKPTKEHLATLYDLINELLPDAPIYYTPEELDELTNKEGIELL
nr:MAG TPA: hypothetical protein [Caudoviricetes sp.]